MLEILYYPIRSVIDDIYTMNSFIFIQNPGLWRLHNTLADLGSYLVKVKVMLKVGNLALKFFSNDLVCFNAYIYLIFTEIANSDSFRL